MKRALNPSTLKHTKPKAAPFKLADGGGMYLLINPSGARLWRYKYRLEGKEQTFALGSYPELSLAQARLDHEKARELVAKGISPTHHRKEKKQEALTETKNSFEAVTRKWMAEKSARWTPLYLLQVKTTMERDVFPKIGKIKIKNVTAAQLRPILVEVASRKQPPDGKKQRARGAATVAILIRQWCSMIFRYAVAHGLADADPAYALRDIVSRPKVQHHSHLLAKELPAFLAKLRGFTGTRQVGIGIELLMLTFVRTGELRRAEWSEIDLEKSIWRIPAEKMKMGREHLVPLSSQAKKLILELQSIAGSNSYLFPNLRSPKTVMSNTTINRALERMGYGGRLSGHGFRGTASTCLNETGYPAHIIEKQLAHDRKSQVEASYNHAEFLSERTKMMSFWSDFVLSQNAKIIPINQTKNKILTA